MFSDKIPQPILPCFHPWKLKMKMGSEVAIMDDSPYFSVEMPDLLQRHLDALTQGSGLSLDIIRERGYRTVLGKKQLSDAGFGKAQWCVPGLLMPVYTPDGQTLPLCYRPDFPRKIRNKELKYELIRGMTSRLDVPPRCSEAIKDPTVDIWITEGLKKGDALAGHGLCAVVLLGVWNFKGKNEFGGVTLLADFDYIPWNGRTVNIVFDSDVMTKPQVRAAIDRLIEHLQRKGAVVNVVYLPDAADGTKVGIDDYLLTHTTEELKALVQEPPPARKAAPPIFDLLDEAPATLSRPLAFLEGHSYVATWLWVQKTVNETLGNGGNVVRHDPPIVTKEKALFIVRNNGTVFGPDDMDRLALEVNLPDVPQEDKLWRTVGMNAYRSGMRPNYAKVYERVVSVFDRFIDFDHSFGQQREMSELSACFSLSTWFAPAFTVLGYPWPSGERGSGKTQWGHCWVNTSYLGMVVLASGSFAALRDLANYGAALLVDDAENLANLYKTDPDKRALFLAGNRRGATIPLKEPNPNGKGWQTKWVNAFCPRGFTAISLPDPVLDSRSIRIPLVRTADRRKGNADPADLRLWPSDQRQLQDDLWATALALMPDAAEVWAELDNETELIGREFEPWRAIIAVGRLFERHGVGGLEGRIRQLMRSYQEEKADVDNGDRALQTLRAILYQKLGDKALDVLDIMDVFPGESEKIMVNSSQLAETIKQIAEQEGMNSEWVSSRAVGWQLKALRFERERDSSSSKRTRLRVITAQRLVKLCQAYGLVKWSPPDDFSTLCTFEGNYPHANVQNGQNVQNVQSESDIDEVRV
jgi:peptidoglycan/xylan/chitin deacetylase (PgdA/CDA1 family)